MQLTDIWMRDPFLLSVDDVQDEMHVLAGSGLPRKKSDPVPIKGKFWLYGTTDAPPSGVGPYSEYPATGFDAYYSDDLVNWEGPIPVFKRPNRFWADTQFWAPEVYLFDTRLIMFATMKKSGKDSNRGVVILESPSGRPEGPFIPLDTRASTPATWSCLDGTLHVEDGTPYMVFCREWTQVGDGQICSMELSRDLLSAKAPRTLFSASHAPWTKNFNSSSSSHHQNFITDGPFLYRCSEELIMLWSSIGQNDQYSVGISRSTSGSVLGPWIHDNKVLFDKDGGHAMISTIRFRRPPSSFGKRSGEHSLLVLALHSPNRQVRESSPRLVGLIEDRDQSGSVKLDWFDFLQK